MVNILTYLPVVVFSVFLASAAIYGRRREIPGRRGVLPAEYIVFLSAVFVLAGGMLVSRHMAREAGARQMAELSSRVKDTALALNVSHLQKLSFTPADETLPEFRRVTRQLLALSSRPGKGFGRLYTVARRHGVVVFGPEGYEKEHPYAVAPGTVYENPPPELAAVFTKGEPATAGPYSDEFGRFVSAYFPVTDPATDEIILVAGLDMDAAKFAGRMRAACIVPSAVTIILLAMLFALFLTLRAEDAPVVKRLRKYRLSVCFTAAFGITLTVFAVLAVRDAGTRRQREDFKALARAVGADIRIEMNEAHSFLQLLAGLFSASEHVTGEAFTAFTAPILESGTVLSVNWVPAVPAAAVGRFEAAARREGLAGFYMWKPGEDGARVHVSGRDVYYPNLYHASRTMFGKESLGIDMGVEPARRRALEEAAVTGLAKATDGVALFALPGAPQGIIVFLPAESGTQKGFVSMVLRADALILHTFRRHRQGFTG